MKFTIYAKKEDNRISIWAMGNHYFYCLYKDITGHYDCDKLNYGQYLFWLDEDYALTNNDYGVAHYLFDIGDYDMLVEKMIDSLKAILEEKIKITIKEKEFHKNFKQLKKVYINI
jgi:hypothetical protein